CRIRDQQAPVPGRLVAQRTAVVVDLQHAPAQPEPVLAHAAADRQQLLVRQPQLVDVERPHRVPPVGRKADVEGRLGQSQHQAGGVMSTPKAAWKRRRYCSSSGSAPSETQSWSLMVARPARIDSPPQEHGYRNCGDSVVTASYT